MSAAIDLGGMRLIDILQPDKIEIHVKNIKKNRGKPNSISTAFSWFLHNVGYTSFYPALF
jgi:hypothetical protein